MKVAKSVARWLARRSHLIALAIASAVALALAASVIEVLAPWLGVGRAVIGDCPADRAVAALNIVVKNGWLYVDGLWVAFDKDIPAPAHVTILIKDADGNVMAAGAIHLDEDLPAGETVYVDLEPDIPFENMVDMHSLEMVVYGESTL